MIPSTRTLTLPLAFAIGSTVYLRLRQERLPGMVAGLFVRPTGVAYMVSWGDATESDHFDLELTDRFDPTFEVEDD